MSSAKCPLSPWMPNGPRVDNRIFHRLIFPDKAYDQMQKIMENQRIENPGDAKNPAINWTEQHRLLFNQMMSGYSLLAYRCLNDPKWTMLFVNQWAYTLTGYPPEDFISGRVTYESILHPNDREMVRSVVCEAVAEHRPFQVEYRIITALGDEKWVWDQGRPDTEKQDGKTVIDGLIIEITDRKKLELQFIQAQKMEAIGRLSGGISHDFNNYLTTIIGYGELMAEKLPGRGELRECLEEILKAGKNAADLVRQLLAFSRKQMLSLEIMDINIEIENMKKMFQQLLGEDIFLITHLAPDLNKIRADRTRIQQVIMNLAVNARDAMPRGGTLSIETANTDLGDAYAREHDVKLTPGPYVQISVSDTGCGMEPEIKSQIFEPFYTTKPKEHGTGLGLSTVYGIVKQMDGYIWVYSEPDKGTTFKIHLPAITESPGRLIKKKSTAIRQEPSGNETILLVEDDEMVRNLLVLILEQYGYRVIEAMDGRQALEMVEKYEKDIHLMITDVIMPGINGQELANRVKIKRPGTRVLFMSGYSANTRILNGILDTDVFLIEKPISPKMLGEKIQEVLAAG